jgi:hypothetical protein
MPTDRATFDADASRASWDRAADAWEEGQASGRDYYRHEFFGPIQAAADFGCVRSASHDQVSRRSASGRIWRMQRRFRTT